MFFKHEEPHTREIFSITARNSVHFFRFFVFAAALAGIFASAAHATEFSSTNFRVIDPVLQSASTTEMSSTNFKLLGTVGEIAIGTSTATNFKISSGFLYFPTVASPTVTATAGNGQVSLSWGAVTGFLGWTVSGYNVGQSTTAGGPYTYTSLGDVTSSTRTGLTNGTTYYFVIRPEDALDNSIATSSEVSSVPVAPPPPPPPPPPPSAGGGGGGLILSGPSPTKIILKGKAYPGATVTILKDGTALPVLKAGNDGNFEHEEVLATGGIYAFSLYAVDSEKRRSLTIGFSTSVSKGFTLSISDIVIPSTISADKSQVKQGNDITFYGFAYPNSEVDVIVNSEHALTDTTQSKLTGLWEYTLNSGPLERGEHTVKTQYTTPDKLKAPFSESLAFRVGERDVAFERIDTAALVPIRIPVCSKSGDINNDGKVNIVDFSILLFFWNQRNPVNVCADLNGDGVVNLFDFSIMLFWWTG